SGVVVSGNTATLDLAATGQPNFLADKAPGTMVDFVQGFDLSAASSHLGSLAGQTNFHAQPGMELDYAGSIILASNWNLGAGEVDAAGARAAGLMAADPNIPGKVYVLAGKDAEVFQRFTRLTYRTGGQVDGEAGALTIRASGDLQLKGAITDG